MTLLIRHHSPLPLLTSTRSSAPAACGAPSPVTRVIEAVCAAYGLSRQQLLSRTRPEWIAFPRQVAMALAYELGDYSQDAIASFFCRGDHATVRHAVRRVLARVETEPAVATKVNEIRRALQ